KADLVTGMVGEFPEVQGIMGREYALLEGKSPEVAQAIAEHYLPTQAGGELPVSDIGALVSLADKLDTICGCFGVGLIPTGTADPYALRRSTLGIIAIILDRGYRISVDSLIGRALDLLAPKLTRKRDEVAADVTDFFRTRFTNLMAGRYPADVVEAVVAAASDDLVEAAAKIEALAAFKSRPDFEPLAVAFKRVGNIVKSGVESPVDPALFQAPAEGLLHDAFLSLQQRVNTAVASRDYSKALSEIATLREPVDRFFADVMVMAEDPKVRENRLALLTQIMRLFAGIADFTKISA
ncbi:MAG TPA: glycine--tRNA ligase subunit beta, partial [Geobacterales bacterium]|nr:glycine--tRNA ligase subunit beta [Geobacterales bacterium]